jgi:hypothetical protein
MVLGAEQRVAPGDPDRITSMQSPNATWPSSSRSITEIAVPGCTIWVKPGLTGQPG